MEQQTTKYTVETFNVPRGNVDNGLAVGALICAISSVTFSWLGVVGLITAIISLVLRGKYIYKARAVNGMVKASKILSVFGLVFSIVFMTYYTALIVLWIIYGTSLIN